jgi:hypothetical protein
MHAFSTKNSKDNKKVYDESLHRCLAGVHCPLISIVLQGKICKKHKDSGKPMVKSCFESLKQCKTT